jgi:oxaloacetate decarboxylase alpha subunit
MPNTPQQMLLRGQNILGYRHYADDVVEKFVERAAINGVDVFRIFDAMNDMRNLTTAIKATLAVDKHAQGTISYTVSPVHTMEMWVDLAKEIEDLGAHSICIKDMAGLLKPYVAFDLVSRLKASLDIPVHMQCHATTGMSTATYLKAIEAGVDNVDTAISSMSMTYGHSATESLVAILQDEERDTGLNIELLEEIAGYFREVRKKYAQFEGAMRGVDSRILVAQVPGGMLTNLESQLREQNATERLDEVLEEIPKVREDLGFIPLVTPTSQIVGTQAVINVLAGERYKNVTKETAGVLAGEYGSTPAPLNSQLQKQVLGDVAQITCRPADLLAPELEALTETFNELAKSENIVLADAKIDDVLTYALFPQVATKFLTNRNNPSAFEPAPSAQPTPTTQASSAQSNAADSGSYTVTVDGTPYSVQIEAGSGSVAERMQVSAPAKVAEAGEWMNAGLAGTVHQVLVKVGDVVSVGQKILVLEAMKMETDISAAVAGEVSAINVGSGDQVAVGHPLVLINPS